jgi:hypothetical protein
MRIFICKYELRMITITEQHFLDRDNKILYRRREPFEITRMYGINLKYIIYNNKCLISFELTCFRSQD